MKFKDFPEAVINENVDYTVREITNVIKRYGPRESGNKNCFATQKHIKKEMDTFCDETGFETYKVAPKAFLQWTKFVAAAIFLSVVVCLVLVYTNVFSGVGGNDFFVPQCIVGGVVAVGLFITVMEFLLYKQFVDVFYKKTEGHNFYQKAPYASSYGHPYGMDYRRCRYFRHCCRYYNYRKLCEYGCFRRFYA